ncbi:MAG: DUF1919 domain-containing protein [Clostridiales bacterium]|nr:DUF1919 domain-containing protein [Clostridiales bacterium]
MGNPIKQTFLSVISKMRNCFHKIIFLKIKEKDISIISNDCIGGIIYHDMGSKFLSPTINLFFETNDDYLEYLSDIAYYSSTAPIQIKREDINYPVGEIVNGDKSVVIHFMHYNTFEDAVSKWIERGKRINYDKLFVVWHVVNENGPTKSEIDRFNLLNFNKKLLITGAHCSFNYDYICKLDIYSNNYYNGKILDYTSPVSMRRYLDKTHYYKYMV